MRSGATKSAGTPTNHKQTVPKTPEMLSMYASQPEKGELNMRMNVGLPATIISSMSFALATSKVFVASACPGWSKQWDNMWANAILISVDWKKFSASMPATSCEADIIERR